jgi:hypothetical protein
MEPTIDQLRKNYERFDDAKLIRIATEEAKSLRPEALELLIEIIKKRGLSIDVERGIAAQFLEVDQFLLHEYCELIRSQPCPACNSNKLKLNGTITATFVNGMIMSNYTQEIKIACPDCLDKENNRAIRKTVLLGWWGLFGFIKTFQCFHFNKKMKNQNRIPQANATLKDFVLKRIGRIEAAKNNPAELQAIIKYIR